MHGRITAVFLLSLSLLASAAASADEYPYLAADQSIDIELQEGMPLRLLIPSGDIDVIGVKGNELHAELTIRCETDSGKCAERAAATGFETTERDGRVVVGLKDISFFKSGSMEIDMKIEVPRETSVELLMGAGDLDVKDVSGCLRVDMDAGDLDVEAPADTVRSVAIDVGMGDAGLTVGKKSYEASRPFLVGAEVEWDEGEGECELRADLQFGDATVTLY